MLYGLDEILPDVSRFGAKAVNLHRLQAKGLPVVPGFCLDTAFFDRFCRLNRLGQAGDRALVHGEAWRRRALAGRFDAGQRERLATLFQGLQALGVAGDGSLIARSSSPLEDGRDWAAAGAFVSWDGIVDLPGLETGLRECYASVFAPRALGGLADHFERLPRLAMALLLQPVVAGQISGVAFTCDHLSGRTDLVALDWVAGPCSGLVDGSRPAAHAVFDAHGRVLSSHGPAGGPVLPGTGLAAPEDLARFLPVFRQIADLMGGPQDIEWTHDGRQLWILQSRPVTTLRQPAPDVPDWLAGPAGGWTRDGFRQPLRPLEAEAWLAGVAGSTRQGNACGWDFLCAEGRVYRGWGYRRPLAAAGPRQLDMPALANRLIARGQDAYHHHALPRIRQSQAALEASLRPGLPVLGQRRAGSGLMARALDYVALNAGLHWVAVYGLAYVEPWDPAIHDLAQDLPEFQERLDPGPRFDLLYTPSIMTRLRARWREAAALVQASPELTGLFRLCRSNRLVHARLGGSREGRRLRRQLASLCRLGGQMQYEGDWRDPFALPAVLEPWAGLDILRHQALAGGTLPPNRVTELRQRQRELERQFLAGLAPARRPLARRCLAQARQAFQTRDDHAFWFDQARHGVFARVVHHAGTILVRRGRLADWQDVWYLTAAEIDGLLAGAQELPAGLVERRRAEHRANCRLVPPGEPVAAVQAEAGPAAAGEAGAGVPVPEHLGGRELAGVGTMPDRLAGVAWIHGRERPRTDRPVVLVVPEERACDLTVLLPLVAGVVMDQGSPFSHMAITAREYGLPVLYGTGTACRDLANGQPLVLDGAKGRLQF